MSTLGDRIVRIVTIIIILIISNAAYSPSSIQDR